MFKKIQKIGKRIPSYGQKALLYFKQFGAKTVYYAAQEKLLSKRGDYHAWFMAHKATHQELEQQRERVWADPKVISILVPVYKTPELFLRQMIQSVLDQTYSHWQLCIANASPEDEMVQQVLAKYVAMDSRIVVKNLEENTGISGNTNAALEIATGTFVGLLDHDDLLAPDALYQVMDLLEKEEQIDCVYTDEDKIDATSGDHFDPHFKPDYNVDLLRSCNYICHFFVARREIFEKVGGFRTDFDGSQDFDVILRCIGQSRKVGHVAKMLYHWRVHRESTAGNPASKLYAYDAGCQVVDTYLKKQQVPAKVTVSPMFGHYQVTYPLQGKPLVSVIIRDTGTREDMARCLERLQSATAYKRLEIHVPKAQAESYSKWANETAQKARGKYLLFLDSVVTPKAEEADWIHKLLGDCQRTDVSAAAPKLLYSNGRIYHAGVVIGMNGFAGHVFEGMSGNWKGYINRAKTKMNYSALCGSCFMMERQCFLDLGGFDENLMGSYEAEDLCLRAGQAGGLMLYDPDVCLIYHKKWTKAEAQPDGVDNTYLQEKWSQFIEAGDPCYNPNLSLSKTDYSFE